MSLVAEDESQVQLPCSQKQQNTKVSYLKNPNFAKQMPIYKLQNTLTYNLSQPDEYVCILSLSIQLTIHPTYVKCTMEKKKTIINTDSKIHTSSKTTPQLQLRNYKQMPLEPHLPPYNQKHYCMSTSCIHFLLSLLSCKFYTDNIFARFCRGIIVLNIFHKE